jgi:YYY domain-containing protein
MDFAFLNAAGRSETYPPLDPWLSGFAISYYYFGYVMTSVITRLAVVPEAIGFNLGIAWLVAGTGTGAFGLVYNLVRLGRRETETEIETVNRGKRAAILLGLVAALALPVVGNQQITLEMLYANNVGSDAFWTWLDVRDLNIERPQGDFTPRYESSNWWWWRSSRPINEYSLTGQSVQGLEPIVEFPSFSFVLGDLHPHVMALPFAFLSIAVALMWWLEIRKKEIEDWELSFRSPQSLVGSLQSLLPNLPLYFFTALVLGGLSFLNTWDVLIHLFVVLMAFLLGQWQRRGWDNDLLTQAIVLSFLLVVPAILLYLPFYIGFRSQAGAPYLLPMLMRPTRLPQFLIIFGMPLWVITILMIGIRAKQRFANWRVGLITAVSLITTLLLLMVFLGWIIASSPEGAGQIVGLANELGIGLPARPQTTLAMGWGITAVFAIFPAVIQSKLTYLGTTFLLAALLAMIVSSWATIFNTKGQRDEETKEEDGVTLSPLHPVTPSSLPFLLLLIATGALLTLGPEFVYLRDNFGFRLNTIFKFYYQAWVLFGIGALVGLDYLWREFVNASRIAPVLATVGYGVTFAAALMFPYYAVQSRAVEYRGPVTSENRLPATLNGLAQLQYFNQDEYDAIMWLNDNAEGNPVVLEATGGAYSSYARVSANTGLPTLLGWANHQFQWRGSSTPEPGMREPAIRDIYSRPFWENTGDILNLYNVEYIYVGNLERSTYGNDGVLPSKEKFDEQLEVAYQNNSVTIYRWQPEE